MWGKIVLCILLQQAEKEDKQLDRAYLDLGIEYVNKLGISWYVGIGDISSKVTICY